MTLLGPVVDPKASADFVLGLVARTYDHALHPFFRGTVTSVAAMPAGQLGYLVGVRRPESSVTDPTPYLCVIPGYTPTVGDAVDCMWRDDRVGYVVAVLQAAAAPATPAGVLAPYAGSSAPSGWLLCDGKAVSRAAYAALFVAIGTNFGAGDGSTTFNVPDLRGRAPIGAGTGSGLTARVLAATGGEETHQLVGTEMPAHTHVQNSAGGSGFAGGGFTAAVPSSTGNTGSTGGGGTHNNMQPFIALNFIVKT